MVRGNTFHSVKQLLETCGKEAVVLGSGDSGVLVSGGLAGKVMATTCDGPDGRNFQYVNPRAIKAPDPEKPYDTEGGHRWWSWPEGGREYSLYLPEGTTDFSIGHLNEVWRVPWYFDKVKMVLPRKKGDQSSVSLNVAIDFVNSKGSVFESYVSLSYQLRERPFDLGEEIKYVGYEQKIVFWNTGTQEWRMPYGLIGPWSLNMLEAGDNTWMILLVERGRIEDVVDYCMSGSNRDSRVSSDRFLQRDDYGLFKADAKASGKKGLGPGIAKGYIASIDLHHGLLTIMQVPVHRNKKYFDNRWEPKGLWGGTCIDCYNDDGGLGNFYELEGVCHARVVDTEEDIGMKVGVEHYQVNPSRNELLFDVLKRVTGVDLSREQFR